MERAKKGKINHREKISIGFGNPNKGVVPIPAISRNNRKNAAQEPLLQTVVFLLSHVIPSIKLAHTYSISLKALR